MTATDAARVDIGHYAYRVVWSVEDDEYVATCLEFPSLSWLAGSRNEAVDGLERLLAETVDDLVASGDSVPQPLAERSYSGTFNVRIGKHLHRELVTRAAEEHMSLNQYVTKKLASR